MTNNIKNIQETVEQLQGPVFSIYLNTPPNSENWKIKLKNGLKKTQEYVDAADAEEGKKFSKVCKAVDKHIKDNQSAFTNSLICFASVDDIHLYYLQVPVDNDFQWDVRPATHQLETLLQQYPLGGVILLQRDRIALMTTFLGELVHEVHYELDLEQEDWKQYKGLAFGNVYASGANHRDKYDRRIKENQARWYKRIAPAIEKYARTQHWTEAHIAGPAELTRDMKSLLNLKVTGETTRNYSGKSAHAILEKTILT